LRQVCCHPFLALGTTPQSQDPIDFGELVDLFAAGAATQGGKEAEAARYAVEVLKELESGTMQECVLCFEPIGSIDGGGCLLPCYHIFCGLQCLRTYWTRLELEGKESECPVCRTGPYTEDDLMQFKPSSLKKKNSLNNSLNPLEEDKENSQGSRLRFNLQKEFKTSTKLEALKKALRELEKDSWNERCVVFSQW